MERFSQDSLSWSSLNPCWEIGLQKTDNQDLIAAPMLVLSSFKLHLCSIDGPPVEPSLLLLSTGINKQIAVDAVYFPIVSTADPRAVGLPQDPHGNTLFSSLLSGFFCPLSDPASPSDMPLPQPGRTPRGWAPRYK